MVNIIFLFALWKHHVNLLLQSFRSVSSDLHQSYCNNTTIENQQTRTSICTNLFHHPSIKSSVCKTLINRAKTICEVDNIEGELEHLRNVLKMNGYPKKFIDSAMKTQYNMYGKRLNIGLLSVYRILVQLHIKSKGF